MTPQQRFRFGFLSRCAEEQLPMDEVRSRVKVARQLLGKEAMSFDPGKVLKGMASLAVAPRLYTAALGAGAATLGGAGLGYGAAKLQEKDVDPEDAKRQELVAVYKRYADQARMKAQNTSYRQAKPSSPQLF